MSEIKYKRPVQVRHTVTGAEAGAGEVNILLDKNPEVAKDWYMSQPYVRSSAGATKNSSGLDYTYHTSGAKAGQLTIANGSTTLAADDVITIIGALNFQ